MVNLSKILCFCRRLHSRIWSSKADVIFCTGNRIFHTGCRIRYRKFSIRFVWGIILPLEFVTFEIIDMPFHLWNNQYRKTFIWKNLRFEIFFYLFQMDLIIQKCMLICLNCNQAIHKTRYMYIVHSVCKLNGNIKEYCLKGLGNINGALPTYLGLEIHILKES